jgi:hypothetical protein
MSFLMEDEMGGACSKDGKDKEVHTGRFWCKQNDDIKMDLKEIRREMWSGSIWIRIGSSGRFLCTW